METEIGDLKTFETSLLIADEEEPKKNLFKKLQLIIPQNIQNFNSKREKYWRSFQSEKILKILHFLSGFLIVIGILCIVSALLYSSWIKTCNSRVSSIDNLKDTQNLSNSTVCTSQICFKSADEMTTWMNSSVDPCDNFFEYACGGWINLNSIPIDEWSWNVMSKLNMDNREIIQIELETSTSFKSEALEKARKFYTSCLRAKSNILDPWKICMDETEEYFSLVLGSIFVQKTFDLKWKLKAQNMIRDIKHAFVFILKNVNWMDEKTKKLSIKKITEITNQIGYHESILKSSVLDREYQDVQVDEWDYNGNSERLLAKYLKNVMDSDLDLRRTPPQIVNAFYYRKHNQIVIPAGILQPPYYHPGLPVSINFGGIGVAMGHELNHCFDEAFNEDFTNDTDNFFGWWSHETITEFTSRAQCLVKEFSDIKLDGQNLHGRRLLDENVADQSGLKASFRAYRTRIEKHHKKYQLLPGLELSSDQLFFLSYAQTWCSSSSEEALIKMIDQGTHAPDSLRVLEALKNLPEFSTAFECPLESLMNPLEKCVVW